MFTSRRKSFIATLVTIFIAAFLWFTLPAAPTRAQAPTPVPTPTLTLTEDCIVNGINKCGERVVRENGLFVFILAALVLGAIAFVGYALLKGASKPLEKKSEEVSSRLLERDDAVARYLNAVMPDYRKFNFRGLDTRAKDIFTPELDQAYVSLRMTPEADEKRARKANLSKQDKSSPNDDLELAAALFREQIEPINLAQAIGRAYRLAIVGAAGSGKSTLLQWAGLTMARGRLEPKKLTEEQRAFVQAASDKPLLPILIPLRAFHDDCVNNKHARSAASLLAFLGSYISEKHPTLALPDGFFEKQLRGAGCLMMFDGVDEVPPDERSDVRGAMEDFVREFASNAANRYLVTSRAYAYFGRAEVAGFEKCEVQNLMPAERDALIESWCRAAYEGDEQTTQARDLIARLNTADERVRALAVTPLMTTIFALVHYDSKELPKQRAELYEHAVRILLTDPYHDGAARGDWEERRNRLAAIAFEMHAGAKEELLEDDLVNLCWRAFGNDEKIARKAARDFLRAVVDRGGLLEEENGNYGFFTHRTFREFLAGRYLGEEKTADEQREFLRERLGNDQWFEATQLAAGFLAINGERRANDLILLIADLGATPEERAYALTLAGRALADLPPARVQAETQTRVSQALLEFFQANPPRVEPRLRRPLGLALGAVGDPRFARSPLVVGEGAGWRSPQVVTIPAGEFQMGTNDDQEKELEHQNAQAYGDEKPQHTVYVSEFAIGKYPVTNAEFRAFWLAKGYEKQAYWSDDGWKWRTGKLEENLDWLPSDDLKKSYADWLKNRPLEKRGEPFFWNDPQWNAANLPVVGVTWFEAEAYCKWLTEMGKKGNRETGSQENREVGKQVMYRLPTEAEWEKAARGPQNYLWSWGNEWDANKCNSEESKFNATSPVGMYPDGTWRDEKGNVGPLDMMGNVWEWCGDWWKYDLYETRAQETARDPQGPVSGNARVLRGGSWDYARWDCRAAFRLRDGPMIFNDLIGFRVVVVPIPRT